MEYSIHALKMLGRRGFNKLDADKFIADCETSFERADGCIEYRKKLLGDVTMVLWYSYNVDKVVTIRYEHKLR